MERGGAYADILLDRAQRSIPDPKDRALLTELVMGTLRRRGTLDYILSRHLDRPVGKADVRARNALRLGLYQILYTRVPERAAIFETVEAVKRGRGEKIAGLVNAVLRESVRSGVSTDIPALQGEERLAAELSAPASLLSALSRSLGRAEAAAFLSSSLERPPFAVRANPFRTSRAALLDRLSRAGMAPSPCRYAPDGIVLSEPGGVHSDPGFLAGEYLVMDEGAQLIAPLLAPRPGEAVLDACAAPGGKTNHLSAIAGGGCTIVAADVSEGRVRLLKGTLSRTGTPGVRPLVHDLSAGPLPGSGGGFDKVLVDAPCTGMGVIRRNPDAKWRFRPEWPAEMAILQAAILSNAWASLRPGGLLLYCTCSPFREENEEVVASFLARHPEGEPGRGRPADWPGPEDAWTTDGFLRLSPDRHGTDGFFAALLRRAR